MNSKRILFGTIFGAVSGIICIIGMIFLSGVTDILFLIGGLHNRIIMGILIGFAGDVTLFKDENDSLNAAVRGLIFGAIVSTAGFFYGAQITFFFMGLVYGVLTDILTTLVSKES